MDEESHRFKPSTLAIQQQPFCRVQRYVTVIVEEVPYIFHLLRYIPTALASLDGVQRPVGNRVGFSFLELGSGGQSLFAQFTLWHSR